MKKFIKIFFIAALFVLTLNGVDYGQNVQNITANNTAKYRNDGRYDWTIYIVSDKDTLGRISYVQYTLHPTFDPPVREGKNPGGPYPFSISGNGWDEFSIGVKVFFKDKKFTSFDYQLKLSSNKPKKEILKKYKSYKKA